MPAPEEPWPVETLTTEQLTLEPLRVEHAKEMAIALADSSLYRWTGGEPEGEDALAERYARQVRGRSADGAHWWFNWVLRDRASGAAVGYVQATVVGDLQQRSLAEVAWVVSPAYQGQGLAREAATAVVAWLHARGVTTVIAHVHPEHGASGAVARAIGLRPTDELVYGEVRWTSRR